MEIKLPYFEIINIQSVTPEPIPYGVQMIGAPLEWPETKGKGVKVAVLDTGRPNHPDITVAGAVDFTAAGVDDRQGHGSHVAGTIAANGRIKGVAPECELYAVKVLGDKGNGQYDWLIQGIRWSIDNGMNVISMSLGASKPPDSRLHDVIHEAYTDGITLVVAAGNMGEFGSGTVLYPAVYPECMAVTAVDVEKKNPLWSSKGIEAELAAAGVEVYSTWLNGQYALLSGTSMACPHITGAVALMIAKRRIRGLPVKPDLVRDSMAVYAEDVGPVGRDELHGYGVFSFGRFDAADTVQPRKIELWIDNPQARVDSKVVQVDPYNVNVAPRIIEGRTMVPARFVAENLGANVGWEEKQRKVTITR
jgi:subtilisin family serine protease